MQSTIDERALDDLDFPSLPKRLLWVFVSPGKLNEHLAENPKWFAAMAVTALVIGIGMAAIPIEIFIEAQRMAALERGQEFPDLPEQAVTAMRFVIPGFTVLSTFLFNFVFAGLYTLMFAFILGDEGRYKQYLAVLAHSWFIAAVFSLALTPLRISTENPQFTVNLGSFLLFLPDGYFLNIFRALDLSQIWSTLVFAQGAHAIDRRRSVGSAAAIAMTVLLGFALIAARFI